MPAHRLGWMLSLSGLAGLALIFVVFDLQSTPQHTSLLAAAATQEQELGFSPDTMVGWDRGPEQPILFSHRRHAGAYEINCLYCHTNTDKSPVASMPSVDLCMGCHRVVKAGSPEIQKLRGYQQRREPIRWERIYKLADFVQFNHGRHVRVGVDCQECHGPVQATDVLYQYSSLTMGWCLSCHRQPADAERRAKAERTAVKFELPGRDSTGLYPRSIDSKYGMTRGPIDCVACHY